MPTNTRALTGIFSMVSILCSLLALRCAMAGPTVFPTGLTIADQSGRAHAGYTLYSVKWGDKVVAVDMDGTLVHSWTIPGVGPVVKPLSYGRILTLYGDQGSDDCHTVAEFDWSGAEVWKYTNREFSEVHHDVQRLGNGNTLILATKIRTVASIAPHEIHDNIILEVTPGGETVWQWSTADHYDQLQLSAEGRAMIMDGNYVDIFHTNSIQVLPRNQFMAGDARFRKGNILVSQRKTNLVFLIDKASKQIVWTLHKDTIGQHHACMIPRGLKGAGNILLFDNGGTQGFPPVSRLFSRVLQINPLTYKQTWIYTAYMSNSQDPENFFSTGRSGCQLLPNGNTLITESHWGRIFEVTREGEIVWEYVNPIFRNQAHQGNKTIFTNEVYRAYRVDRDWPNGDIGDFIW